MHSTGASILDPTASSTASEPIEASEGELVGTEQVESAVSCVMAPCSAGDTAEARAAVKPRIEPSVAGEPAEACAAGAADAADAASKLTGASVAGAAAGPTKASVAV